MKKTFFILFLILSVLFPCSAVDYDSVMEHDISNISQDLDLSEYITDDIETEGLFGDSTETPDIITNVIAGNAINNPSQFVSDILSYIFDRVLESIKSISYLIVVIVIIAIAKSIASGGSGNRYGSAVSIAGGLAAGGISITVFAQMTSSCIYAMSESIAFTKMLIPVTTALMASSGYPVASIRTTAVMSLMTVIISSLTEKILIPMISLYLALSATGSMFEQKGICSLADSVYSVFSWLLGISATIFTFLITITSKASTIPDSITTKGIKLAISSLIPVIGKTISDASGAIQQSAEAIKNAVGIIAVILIVLQTVIPIIDMLLRSLMFKASAAISSMMCVDEITPFLTSCSKALTLLASVNAAMGVVLIIGLGNMLLSSV